MENSRSEQTPVGETKSPDEAPKPSSRGARHQSERPGSIGDASQLFGGGGGGLDDFFGPPNGSSHPSQATSFGAVLEEVEPVPGSTNDSSDPFAWPSSTFGSDPSMSFSAVQESQGIHQDSYTSDDPNDFYLSGQSNTALAYPSYDFQTDPSVSSVQDQLQQSINPTTHPGSNPYAPDNHHSFQDQNQTYSDPVVQPSYGNNPRAASVGPGISHQSHQAVTDYNPYASANFYGAANPQGLMTNDYGITGSHLQDAIPRAASVGAYSSVANSGVNPRPSPYLRSNTAHTLTEQPSNASLNRPKVCDAYDPPAIRKKKPLAPSTASSLPSSPALGANAGVPQFGPGPLTSNFSSQIAPPPPKQRSISGPIPAASATRSTSYNVPSHDSNDFYSMTPQGPQSYEPQALNSNPMYPPLTDSNVSNPSHSQYQNNSHINNYDNNSHINNYDYAPPPPKTIGGSVSSGPDSFGAFSYQSQESSYSDLNPSNPYSSSALSRVDDPYAPVDSNATKPDTFQKQPDYMKYGPSGSAYTSAAASQYGGDFSQLGNGQPLPSLATVNKPSSYPTFGTSNDIQKPPSPDFYGPSSPSSPTALSPTHDRKPKKSSPLKPALPVESVESDSANAKLPSEASHLTPASDYTVNHQAGERAMADSFDEINLAASKLSLNSPPSSPQTTGLSGTASPVAPPPGGISKNLENATSGNQFLASQPSGSLSMAGLSVPAVHVQPATPEMPIVEVEEMAPASSFDVLADLGGGPASDSADVSNNSYQNPYAITNPGYEPDSFSNSATHPTDGNFSEAASISGHLYSSPQAMDGIFSQSFNPYAPPPKSENSFDSDRKPTDPFSASGVNSFPHQTSQPFRPFSESLSHDYASKAGFTQPEIPAQGEFNSGFTPEQNPYAPSGAGLETPYGVGSNQAAQVNPYNPNAQPATMNSDGTTDPMLQRLTVKVPVATFGFGGKLVTIFPAVDNLISTSGQPGFEDPYSGTNTFGTSSDPTKVGTTVTVQHLSAVIPVAELQNYPGPLFMDGGSKSSVGKKRKEASEWLDSKLNESEQELTFVQSISGGNRPAHGMVIGEGQESKVIGLQDKILLIKLLKVLIENEGKLSGSQKVEEAVRAILQTPGNSHSSAEPAPTIPLHHSSESPSSSPELRTGATLQDVVATYRVRASTLDELQASFSEGNRPKALKIALDQKMWAHALVIANSIGNDTWRETVREFVRYELSESESSSPDGRVEGKPLSSGRESLRVLYNLLAGAGSAALGEFLPPSHSLAPPVSSLVPNFEPYGLSPATVPVPGVAMAVSRANSPAPPPQPELRQLPANVPDSVLNQWRSTVALTIANRVPGSGPFLMGLGDLLLKNGRVYAAHITYLLSNGAAPLLTLESGDRITLLGDDNPISDQRSGLNVEAVMFTEVLELALSLAPTVKNQDPFIGIPHLQSYRLALSLEYASHGLTSRASRYCEALGGTLKLATKPCPFYHATLLEQSKTLSVRLSAAPASEKGSSWISRKMPRPMLDNVWQTLEGRVHKFVAGEDEQADPSGYGSGNASSQNKTVGPFSHYSSISPANTSGTLSRVQSNSDLAFANNPPSNGMSRPFPTSSPFQRPSSGADYSSPYERDPRQRSTSAMVTYESSSSSPVNWGPDAENKEDNSGKPLLHGFSQQPQQPSSMATASAEAPSQENNMGGYGGWWEAASQQGTAAISSQPTFASVEDVALTEDGSGFIDPMASFGMPAFNATGAGSNSPANNHSTYDEAEEDDLGFGNSSSRKRQQSIKDESSESSTAHETEKPEKLSSSTPANAKAEDKSIKPAPSSSWLGRWFKRDATPGSTGSGPVKANLGEEVSLVYDPETKRWVSKKAGQSSSPSSGGAPPPPPARAQTASPTSSMRAQAEPPPASGSRPPPLPMARTKTMDIPAGRSSLDSQSFGPPPTSRSVSSSNLSPGTGGGGGGPPPPPSSSSQGSNSAGLAPPPPLSSAAGKKPATKKNIRSRYVEIR